MKKFVTLTIVLVLVLAAFVVPPASAAPAATWYNPTPKAYEEGGYEVRSSSLAPEAGKALVDAAIELVGGLRSHCSE